MTDTPDTPLPEEREPPPGTVMTQWVIYDHPSDHPNGYVLRAAYIGQDNTITIDNAAWYSRNLETLRRIVPPGLVNLSRFADDDPAILEVWL